MSGMKKFLLGLMTIAFLSSCFIFKKKEKYGCPANGRSMGAERIASGEPKAVKLSNKAKFRGN
jgi:hypothetical protein